MDKRAFIENFLILSPSGLHELFKDTQHPVDCLGLYVYYCYKAELQNTNIISAITSTTAKDFKWSPERVRRTKKILINLDLIEDIISKNERGKINGHFIKLKGAKI